MKKLVLILVLTSIFIPNVCAFEINTKSMIAVDAASGRVFYSKNQDDKRLIASTTKIATAIVAIENSNLDDLVLVGNEILSVYGSNIYLEHNEHMLMLDLLYGLMLRSGNDAAVVVANHVAGSLDKFVELMNNKAKELEMNDTVFYNPHGLDEETKNISTAHDLAILYGYAYKNDIFKKIVNTKKYAVQTDKKSYIWFNRNTLLNNYKYATGGKTGYTPSAGRVLVTSANKNNLDIIIVSFNDIYDYDLHIKIYESIFKKYNNELLLDKNSFFIENSYDGELYINESLYYPLSSDELYKIERKVVFNDTNVLKDKSQVGTIYFYLDNNIIGSRNLYIKLEKVGFLKRIIGFLKNIFS